MSTLQIVSVSPSKTGKSFICKSSDGRDFFAKIDSGIQPGLLDCETEASFYQGKERIWIAKWKPSTDQTIHVTAPAREEPSYKPNIAPWWMPFVSNTVGNGMRAGTIDSPEKVAAYARAAHQVALELSGEEIVPF